MNAQNYKNVCPKDFDFCEILKMREKIFENSRKFFVIILYCKKRRCSQIELQIKVQIEDVRKAP